MHAVPSPLLSSLFSSHSCCTRLDVVLAPPNGAEEPRTPGQCAKAFFPSCWASCRQICTITHTHTHTHTRACIHTHTQTHAHTRACIHTHTHTHTHTYPQYVCVCVLSEMVCIPRTALTSSISLCLPLPDFAFLTLCRLLRWKSTLCEQDRPPCRHRRASKLHQWCL